MAGRRLVARRAVEPILADELSRERAPLLDHRSLELGEAREVAGPGAVGDRGGVGDVRVALDLGGGICADQGRGMRQMSASADACDGARGTCEDLTGLGVDLGRRRGGVRLDRRECGARPARRIGLPARRRLLDHSADRGVHGDLGARINFGLQTVDTEGWRGRLGLGRRKGGTLPARRVGLPTRRRRHDHGARSGVSEGGQHDVTDFGETSRIK